MVTWCFWLKKVNFGVKVESDPHQSYIRLTSELEIITNLVLFWVIFGLDLCWTYIGVTLELEIITNLVHFWLNYGVWFFVFGAAKI